MNELTLDEMKDVFGGMNKTELVKAIAACMPTEEESDPDGH
jgi:hypothetical protein